VWNWTVHNRPTIEGMCSGAWLRDGKVSIPQEYRDWMGSMKDGTVGLAPLNLNALGNHPRREEVQRLYAEEIAAFKSGAKSFVSIFTGPIRDNTGRLRIDGTPEVAALYDERAQWFVENVVGTP
jgi:hypothetical protein